MPRPLQAKGLAEVELVDGISDELPVDQSFERMVGTPGTACMVLPVR